MLNENTAVSQYTGISHTTIFSFPKMISKTLSVFEKLRRVLTFGFWNIYHFGFRDVFLEAIARP